MFERWPLNSQIFVAGFQLLADILSRKPDEKWYFCISITIPIINGIAVESHNNATITNYFFSGVVTPFVTSLRPIRTNDGYVIINCPPKTNLCKGVFLLIGLNHSMFLGLNN